MYSKISNWLATQDEKFLSNVKEESKRKILLDQLYNLRMMFVFSFVIPIILFIFQVVLGVSDPTALLILLTLMILYSMIDSTIRAVRLYELSLDADRKS